jgi:hypothetical protein
MDPRLFSPATNEEKHCISHTSPNGDEISPELKPGKKKQSLSNLDPYETKLFDGDSDFKNCSAEILALYLNLIFSSPETWPERSSPRRPAVCL